ncbi:MATE family efflux transporter [Bacillus sp. FJAT-50079]|uniref:MATE family efflux transporter n=1 Tax=Bacillus sp. FJAT-50079 TaxID=2833577 RepID=UPI001BC95216|nr:MATE family efflux transporter [Bacillus sp. FJAT-50079]MBS4209853.1 MATE family efflux transporter [Bacillus sp. FJAT-50079]
MRQTYHLRERLQQLWVILIPLLITQLALFMMTFFDIMMTGRFSSDHLAGVAVGSSLWVPISTGLSGILLAITPIVGHLIGARKKQDVPISVIQGVFVAITMAIIIIIIGAFILNPVLDSMNLEDNVRHVAKHYLIYLSFGIIPLFVYNVLRAFIDALGKTRVTMIVTLTSLPIHFVLNYIFIFGKLGLPALGGIGAGIASAITYWIITLIAIWIIHKKAPFRDFGIFKTRARIHLQKWKEIFSLGLPIGLSIFIETSIFSAVTLFMSTFGTNVIAAHQAALNFASLLYMIPLSISMALTILIGYEVGAGRHKDARSYSWIGVMSGVSLSLLMGILLFIYRIEVAHIYSDDLEVVKLTSQFLLFAVFFQLSDAVQAPIQGALRGYKDVNVTFIMALISFWIIGLPVGFVLANYTELGPYGYWLGLIIGLAVGAITLSLRLRFIQKKYIAAIKNEQV